MFVLLLVLIAVLFGFGFLHPIWWVAAAVLVYGAIRQGRDHGGGLTRGGGSGPGDSRGARDYQEYRQRRDRQNRWDRRYFRQNRARLRREDRRDHEHDG
ncbi:hypothetical protein PV682_04170 [Streptomyces niveiscabiei]|uniref:hypothetical protein n=1 Tax=Streptomyces niveiscabiei TaxID=164115 RepID=UPI0029A00F17|nr:hypothetical protein [Streptomyces niveiscabiei]MDX3380645.1 hypothetical protein [Streptomyces niveiscabiei]